MVPVPWRDLLLTDGSGRAGDKRLDGPDEPCGVLEQEVVAGVTIHKQPRTARYRLAAGRWQSQ